MSTRNIRKLAGKNVLPPQDDDSDDGYQPLYVRSSSSRFKYEGLVLSSGSEPEPEAEEEETEETSSSHGARKKENKKRKKRKAKHPKTCSVKTEDMDEVEKSVMEVNAILGAPSVSSIPTVEPQPNPEYELFNINHRHINVTNELKKLFGPEPKEKKRGRQINFNRIVKPVIVPLPKEAIFYCQKGGLSMEIQGVDKGIKYFAFNHTKEYQRIHKLYLHMSLERSNTMALPTQEYQKQTHVEVLMETADSLLMVEDYTRANKLVKQIVAYMHHVCHPNFNITDRNIRLEYVYLENRPFHVILLKYLHLLTSTACHRTALEIAKLLLNLDPSDPLAVIFIVDTVALRAREHQWLVDAVAYWSKERDAEFLFNIQYSLAMANFHLAKDRKEDVAFASQQLQTAMMRFPSVVPQILKCGGVTIDSRLQSHPLFNLSNGRSEKILTELTNLYAELTSSKWREPNVMQWLMTNINELMDKYDNDPAMRDYVNKLTTERLTIFQALPQEVARHLCVIKPMAALLFEGPLPQLPRVRSFDPLPPTVGINRYNYDTSLMPNVTYVRNSTLYELLLSIVPDYTVVLATERYLADALDNFDEEGWAAIWHDEEVERFQELVRDAQGRINDQAAPAQIADQETSQEGAVQQNASAAEARTAAASGRANDAGHESNAGAGAKTNDADANDTDVTATDLDTTLEYDAGDSSISSDFITSVGVLSDVMCRLIEVCEADLAQGQQESDDEPDQTPNPNEK